jgi:hypothetical protein
VIPDGNQWAAGIPAAVNAAALIARAFWADVLSINEFIMLPIT